MDTVESREGESLRQEADSLYTGLAQEIGNNPNFPKLAGQASALMEKLQSQGRDLSTIGLPPEKIKLLEVAIALFLEGRFDPKAKLVAVAEPEPDQT